MIKILCMVGRLWLRLYLSLTETRTQIYLETNGQTIRFSILHIGKAQIELWSMLQAEHNINALKWNIKEY